MLSSHSTALQRVCKPRELSSSAQQLSNNTGNAAAAGRPIPNMRALNSCCLLPNNCREVLQLQARPLGARGLYTFRSQKESPAAAGQAIGVHEGPREVALQVDGGSPMPSIVPNMEAPGQTPFSAKGEIIYSKGAAVLHMLEAYWNAAHEGAFRVSCCQQG